MRPLLAFGFLGRMIDFGWWAGLDPFRYPTTIMD